MVGTSSYDLWWPAEILGRDNTGAVDQSFFVYLFGEVDKQSRFVLPFERQATLADALFDEGNGIAKET